MTSREPPPELCKHDDPSWCTAECEAKNKAFDEWLRKNVRPVAATEWLYEVMRCTSPDEMYGQEVKR